MKTRLIISGLTLAVASISQAAYTPVAIQSTSYNADVIVESNATPSLPVVTSATIDNGTNNTANTWFEVGYDLVHPANGIPLHGSTFTALDNANDSYQMAPDYTKPNGILIAADVTTGAFTLGSPKAYATLSVLGMGGNGGDAMTATIHHQDGTSEVATFATSDWFGTPNPGIAWIANGRCNNPNNLTTETNGTSGDGLGNPRIYHHEINLSNTTSPVTNVVFTYVSGAGGSHSDVMALSGATTVGGPITPITVTGYDYDFVVEATAPHGGRVLSQTVVAGTNVWATSESLDNTANTGNAWYEQGYNQNNDAGLAYNVESDDCTGTGLPHPGGFITNSTQDHIYQMPPDYTVNNAIYISSADTTTNDTITLITQTAYSGISLLASASNGPVPVNYVITHAGGITETGVVTVGDWFNSGNATFVANGRVAVDTADFANVKSGFPILHQNDIVLSDAIDPVVSIYLENTNGADQGLTSGRFAILAVSGNVGALPPNIVQQPVSVNQYVGSSISFTSTAAANAPITYQWQKGTNSVYVNLTDGGNISGSTTTNLTINPLGYTDQASYRLVATDTGYYADSSAATLGVFSTNLDVTEPGDPITGVNFSAFGDGQVSYAIDDSMDTKLGGNISGGVVGLVITPVAGLTVVSALRIYTGSDSTGRDPASYELEGSVDGGHTYTLISSNSIALSDNRNPLVAGEAPNPLTQVVTEVRFPNVIGYTTYKILFPTEKGSGQLQFDEMELLGTNETSEPYFSPQPFDQTAWGAPPVSSYGLNSATFTAVPVFTPTPTVSWFKGTNGVYVPLTDGGNILGSQTTSLTVNPTTFADSADYVAVANSTVGYVTSSIAHLFIYSTNVDVSQPSDTTTDIGDTTGTYYGTYASPANAIDDTFTEWKNGGSGFSAGAGFPPFNGPVGMTVTPAVGSTVLNGLRFYPGQDAANYDPSSFVLEGSNDGTTYATIASGPLALPLARNSVALVVDPTQSAAQEILFSNTRSFTTYRLTFPNVVNSNNAAYLEVGEVEFLGIPGGGALAIFRTTLSGGNLTISGIGGTANGSFTVQTNSNLTLPNWGPAMTGSFDSLGNFSISLPVSSTNPSLFYRIQTP